MGDILTLDDLRLVAKRRLPRMVFDFIDGGAEDERTLRANREAFERRTFEPRLLSTAAERDQSVTVLGERLATPVLLAPTGLSRLAGPGGETAAAKAAQKRGTVSVISSASSVAVGEVGRSVERPQWFQLYPWGDWELTSALMDRAKAAGVTTLVLTLDVPVTGARERDYRNGMTIPVRINPRTAFDVLSHPAWALKVLTGKRITMANLVGLREGHGSSAASLAQLNLSLLNPSYSWDDVRRVRDYWAGRLVLKGIMGAADARRSVDAGADGVIVSNHGGRQADAIPASLDVLADVAAEIGTEAEILFDGGIRRGTDVVMALALGARAVLVGRPWMYGLAAGGQSGVEKMFDILSTEIDRTLALVGARSIADLDASFVRNRPGTFVSEAAR
ncbi:alpha-hydroxy-acid oxidizing protein [Pseudarthrobacter psychrotolerans]|uniref:Alpha-hydroxy-acid oxidizing protein n=1 Tax=Pseudarthrobacter psychrotolerans TaxID=2697569 RepID=A0A6P1NGR8_9MICC|nr:alpha-hydroxy acid oxidase [Pseudarthrobacter psychrotolerans]QHK18558.1 alpha-hydroxy-acid oxidizing protein [Pseudarthrobacter psychrotolerans]